MVEGSIVGTVYLPTQSFYAKVGDDFRIYIPKHFREALKIYEGDIVGVIVATIIRKKTIYVPGEIDKD